MSTPETQPKSKQIQPENFPERLVWYAMTGTYTKSAYQSILLV